ncbi:MAG: T9SS type A sorting domain-containing protein, partial [Bacteroidales bacterium]|nr:T9SS type A sorting domain-containing protein [Bacteroidales bacterium]
NKKTNSYVDTTQFYYEKNWWDGPDPIGARFGNAWATPPYNEFATTVDTGTSYLIEISFDWARFGVTPIVGEEFGYDVKLSDNDGDGATPSEGRCQLAWSDTTDTGWNVPRVFGELILKADGTFATFTRPDQPDTLIAAVSEDTVVSLSWTAVDGADGYNLYRDDVLIAAGVNDESYVDNVPAESATYTYGVRAVVDGIKSLATEAVVDIVVGIHESTLAGLEVFPIPATNFVNINIESEILSISVYNVTGQLVKQLNNLNTSQYQLDLNGLSSGMYILNINAVEGYDIVRIIKQ